MWGEGKPTEVWGRRLSRTCIVTDCAPTCVLAAGPASTALMRSLVIACWMLISYSLTGRGGPGSVT